MSNYQYHTLLLFLGVTLFLIVASLIGLTLKHRIRSPNRVIDN